MEARGADQNSGSSPAPTVFMAQPTPLAGHDALDAANYFTQVVPISLEQPGGSLGGRILKDKLFWFGSFEALHYTVGDAALDTVPSFSGTADPVGDPNSSLTIFDACTAVTLAKVNPLSALIAGLPIGASGAPTSCVPQAASPTHENMFPFVTTAPVGNQAATFAPGLTTLNPYYNGLIKIDYNRDYILDSTTHFC